MLYAVNCKSEETEMIDKFWLLINFSVCVAEREKGGRQARPGELLKERTKEEVLTGSEEVSVYSFICFSCTTSRLVCIRPSMNS